MGQKDARPHHGQPVQVEQGDGLTKVEEDELGAHQRVGEQLLPDKGEDPANRHQHPYNGEQGGAHTDGQSFRDFLAIPRNHPPVEAQAVQPDGHFTLGVGRGAAGEGEALQ